MKIGAVFAPLNASLSGDPLVHVISRAGGSMLVCDGALAGLARSALDAIPKPPVTLVTGTRVPSGFASFDQAVATASTVPPAPPGARPRGAGQADVHLGDDRGIQGRPLEPGC